MAAEAARPRGAAAHALSIYADAVLRPVRACFIAFVLAGSSSAPARAATAVEVPAGDGSTLRVETAPFRVVLADASGAETVATVPAGTVPLRAPGADGPQPLEPAGAAGGFPALGFVVGARAGTTFPVSFFTGNRLFGAEVGGLSEVTGVQQVTRREDGADLAVTLSTGGAPALLALRRRGGGGVKLTLSPPPGLPAVSTLFTLGSPAGEGLYGLGGRKDAFDQRGRLRNVWVEQQNAADERTDPATGTYSFPNGDQASYYVQTSLFGARGWGAWTGGTALQRLDLAASRGDAVRWGVAEPTLELTLAGGGVEQASKAYTASVGRAPAPPKWVYAPWIDVLNEGEGEAAPNGAGFTGGTRVKADLDAIVAKLEELDIPVGTLGVEGWHKVLDEEGPKAKAYYAGLRKRGFHLSAYWNPFTSPAGKGYAEALERGLFIRDAAGRPYPIVTNRFGVSNVIDFTHPAAAAYFKRQVDRSADLGFEAFMEDFGELVTEGMTFADAKPVELAHNAYPTAYHRAGRAAIDAQARERPGFEPWFYVRAGHNGTSASTGGVFPGDETTDWSIGSGLPSVVPALLNHALGGSPTFTTDVGGYLDLTAPRTSPELLIRWSQLAAFTPISRIHNSTGKGTLLPWEAGDAAVDAYRRYARAKVKLAGLMDRWTRRAAADGTIGPVRPLLLDDPSPAAARVGDEWRIGRDLLVAPILRRGATSREVYLPAGERWERVRVAQDGSLAGEGKLLPGGTRVTADAPLADIPLFRRAVTFRLTRRCVGAGRLRVRVEGDTGSITTQATRLGSSVVSRRGAVVLSRRTLERTRAKGIRARLELEDGRVVRLTRPLPSCGLKR